MDLLPTLALLYFEHRLGLKLSYSQAALLAGMGLQRLKLEHVAR
jgi:hypothetical protein